MLLEIIQDHFIAVALCAFLILFILTNNNFEKRTNRLFLGAICCVLVLIVEEAWESQLAAGSVYVPMRVVLSALGYSLRPLIPYLLILAVMRSTPRTQLLLGIPVVINALISFSPLFSHLAFWYTLDNEFVRGPLGLSPFITAGFYLFSLVYLSFRQYRVGNGTETLIVTAIVLLTITATILESFFHIPFIQNPGMAMSITFYYLFLHSNQSNRDPLTGAFTRRRFYVDGEKYASSLTAVISLDVNHLKELNDQFGHIAGDRALIAVTDVIKRRMGPHASLYRTGGDEFMVLCFKLPEKKVQEIIGQIRADLEQTIYRCAIGYAPYTPTSDLNLVCHLADNAMYANKRQMKKAAALS